MKRFKDLGVWKQWAPALVFALLSVTACRGALSTPAPALGPGLTALPEERVASPGQAAASPTPSLAHPLTPTAAGPALAAPPPGILYRTGEGLFITTASGGSRLLESPTAESARGAASPDGEFLLVSEPEEQVLVSQVDHSRNPIWPRPGLNLCPFGWVWGQPALLVTTLLPEGVPPALSCSRGSPVLLEAHTQSLQVLDASASGWGGFAISPAGSSMAYDVDGVPWRVAFGGDPERLGLERFPGLAGARLADPAWSPDGQRLAWTFRGVGAQPQAGVVVFDLATGTADLFTPYDVSGTESFRPQLRFSPSGLDLVLNHYQAAEGVFASLVLSLEKGEARPLDGFFSQWSPQGSWLLVEKSPGSPDACRLVVESPDGQRKIPICRGDQAWWSPDETRLLTHPYNREAFWLTDLDSGETMQVDLPPGAHIVGWGDQR